jgi:putative SOS response-associated peptidase YedK
MAPVHDRMPAFLAPAKWSEWLDAGNDDVVSLSALLVPAPVTLLTMYPVSTAVNNVRSNGIELIEPADPIEPSGQGSLLA